MAVDIGRRQFISALAGTIGAWPLAAGAQQGGMRHLGVLAIGLESDAFSKANIDVFSQALDALGWKVGSTFRLIGAGTAPTQRSPNAKQRNWSRSSRR